MFSIISLAPIAQTSPIPRIKGLPGQETISLEDIEHKLKDKRSHASITSFVPFMQAAMRLQRFDLLARIYDARARAPFAFAQYRRYCLLAATARSMDARQRCRPDEALRYLTEMPEEVRGCTEWMIEYACVCHDLGQFNEAILNFDMARDMGDEATVNACDEGLQRTSDAVEALALASAARQRSAFVKCLPAVQALAARFRRFFGRI